jgi:hypothetical protein
MRIAGDPRKGVAFDSKHWNVLFDVDGDGYKEYWVDLDGAFSANGADRVQILYSNANRQDIPDPNAARVTEFTALHSPDGTCAAPSPGVSHTRVLATNDGTGDYWIDIQVPMTAFKDLAGNQVLFPDSPTAFVFSTGASNQDPLQKDWMQDLNFLSLADPITFGDIIIPNGQPTIDFTGPGLNPVSFYGIGDNVYVYLKDPRSNTNSSLVECINVTVTNPATGDDESVRLCETGPATGIFTNKGGACRATITNPNPAPAPPTAWIPQIRTSDTIQENWTVTYNSGTNNWIVAGSVSGTQTLGATAGTAYTSDGGQVSFTLYQNGPSNGTVLSFCTEAADPLTTSSLGGTDDDGNLQVFSGDNIAVSFTNPLGLTVTDTASIVGPCQAFIDFTRANGLPSTQFQLTADPATSDRLYVTVSLREANTNPNVAETIQITLTGNDTQTLTLTETGPNTGQFRNTTGLQTKITDGVVAANDNLWEDVDLGVVTATYNYTCGGQNLSASTTASLFVTATGGRVYFTNGAGTQDVTLYGAGQPIFIKVTDVNACGGGTVQVTVTSSSGDSETVTLYQTAAGSGVFMNRRNDLVTTAGSAVVTSASSTFITDGVQPGDAFVIATGPDVGTYFVQSVNSQTQITLTQTLSSTRTGIGFNARPLMTATSDGVFVANDRVLESNHNDTLTVSYTDCNDGDSDPTNDVKTDTASYNAPSLAINEVLFYPNYNPNDPAACQTEAVEILNTASTPINATGYRIADEDGFSYTIPQFNGADIVLQPGQKIFVSLWDNNPRSPFFYNGTYYLFAVAGSTYPADRLADPASGDPADQVLLFDPAGVVQDYVGWSAILTPSIDFAGDDSPAVLRSIWQDDAFVDVRTIPIGNSIVRSPSGVDTNRPSDWQFASNNDCQVVATRAVISAFRAFRHGAGVSVEWETASEEGTLGFYLYRLDERAGQFVRVNEELAPALLDAPQGGIYRLEDRSIGARRQATYALMEIEAGPSATRELFHGPYTVEFESGVSPHRASPRGRGFRAAAREISRAERTRLGAQGEARDARGRARQTGRRALAESSRAIARKKVKVAVVESGLHSVGVRELAEAFEAPEGAVSAWVQHGQLRLTHRGREVAWTPAPDGSGLQFWAEKIESIYTREDVYWLQMRKGLPMGVVSGKGVRQTGTEQTLTETLHLEEDVFFATAAARDPESDYWHWKGVSAGNPVHGRQSFTFNAQGVAPSGSASLAVYLYGATSGEAGGHHVEVNLNGVPVGGGRWKGIGPATVRVHFDQSVLREGENTLQVVGLLEPKTPFSIFYIDSFDVSYQRYYRATGPSFLCRSEGKRVVTISGFSEPDIRVFELTDPSRPARVQGATVDRDEKGYRVSFSADSSADGVYLAVTAAGVLSPAEVWLDEPSRLRWPSNGAEYVVIAPEGLEEAAQQLADWRSAQGHSTLVVGLEDIMDEFNHGVSSPHAIRDFLTYAHRYWNVAPRYVVLAGAGSLDYRNILKRGGNLVPPLMVSTPDGLYASDGSFGDVDGDGWPEMAVGRLPVLSAAELEAYLEKIKAYEAGAGGVGRDRVLLLADNNPTGVGDFARDSESMAAVLQPGFRAERIYLSELTPREARERLIAGIREGALLLSYVGHGGADRMADEGLLLLSDVPQLANGAKLPVVTGFSCTINRFEIPGWASLGELLTIEPQGGAAAVWAPSGLSLDSQARTLGGAYFRSTFEEGRTVLGEAILDALEEFRVRGGLPYLGRIYNLLGDPALQVR